MARLQTLALDQTRELSAGIRGMTRIAGESTR
jgi:hypothetical protein